MFSGPAGEVRCDKPVVSHTKWSDKWIEEHPELSVFLPLHSDPPKIFCKACCKEFRLFRGKAGLIEHVKGRKHKKSSMKCEGIVSPDGLRASHNRFPKRRKSTSNILMHESSEQSASEDRTGRKFKKSWWKYKRMPSQDDLPASHNGFPKRRKRTSNTLMHESIEQSAREIGSEGLQNSGNQKSSKTRDDHSYSKRIRAAPIIQTPSETFIENTPTTTETLVESKETSSSESVGIFKESKSGNGVKADLSLRKEDSRYPEREDSRSLRHELDVQDSEILWCLFCVRHHLPYSAFNTIDFQKMFPDSHLVQRTINHNPKRFAYITNYGLALYYRRELVCVLDKVRHCVLVFKEIFYAVAGYKQIDIYIRFWNTDSHQVRTRYFISVFNKFDVQAEDVAESIWGYLKDLENCRIIQMCVDASPVSLQYLSCLQKKFKKHFSYDVVDLNNSLHSIYEAFESGEEASQWKLGDILRSLYLIFKDSPERCAEYVKITKSREFPLPFHSQRLLLNIQTAERAFEIWYNIRKYIHFICSEYPSMSMSNYFAIVKQACDDVLMPVKLKFFISIGKRLESLINLLKCEKPMLPFFYKLLKTFEGSCKYYSEIKRRNCSDVGSVDKLVDFELTNNTLPLLTEVRLGFSGEKILKQMAQDKLTAIQEAVVKVSTQEFVLKLAEKLMNDPYLNNPLFEWLSCLDPSLVVSNTEDCINKFSRILLLFREKSHLCESIRQELLEQFALFLDDAVLNHKSDFEKFDYAEDNCRLDTFLHSYLSDGKYPKLWHFVTGLLVLFNGQVDLTRFFALGEDVAFEGIGIDYTKRRFISDLLMYDDANVVVTDKMRGVVNEALQNPLDQDWKADQLSS